VLRIQQHWSNLRMCLVTFILRQHRKRRASIEALRCAVKRPRFGWKGSKRPSNGCRADASVSLYRHDDHEMRREGFSRRPPDSVACYFSFCLTWKSERLSLRRPISEAVKIIKDYRPGSAGVPPARVERNQLSCITALNSKLCFRAGFRWTRAGGDACAPRTTMLYYLLGSMEIFQILTTNLIARSSEPILQAEGILPVTASLTGLVCTH